MGKALLIVLCYCSWLLAPTHGSFRYYSFYLPYGSGDNVVSTFHNHGGPKTPHRKWHVECLDGEAMVGMRDIADDFGRIDSVWCRHVFPYKTPTSGAYPYYPHCHVLDFGSNYFCYQAQNSSGTMNTFVTGLWDNEFTFTLLRFGTSGTIGDDAVNPYKCCKVPKGYYIDYVSCYYAVSHDQYWEYFDSSFQFTLACGTGYVMTGLAKKIWPYIREWYVDWIQCCRVGYGPPLALSPPVTNNMKGIPTFYASPTKDSPLLNPAAMGSYRSLERQVELATGPYANASDSLAARFDELDGMRYREGPIPAKLNSRDHSHEAMLRHYDDPRHVILRTDLG